MTAFLVRQLYGLDPLESITESTEIHRIRVRLVRPGNTHVSAN